MNKRLHTGERDPIMNTMEGSGGRQYRLDGKSAEAGNLVIVGDRLLSFTSADKSKHVLLSAHAYNLHNILLLANQPIKHIRLLDVSVHYCWTKRDTEIYSWILLDLFMEDDVICTNNTTEGFFYFDIQ